MTEDREGDIRILFADDAAELAQVFDGRAQSPDAQVTELLVIAAVLAETRLAVPAMVVGVDGVAGGNERLRELLVPSGVLAEPVRDLQDALRLRGGPAVVVDRDALGVGELVVGSRRSSHGSLLARAYRIAR